MINPSSREADFTTKEEEKSNVSKASSSSTSWSRSKDPRIVRVSRALGGKDRHSKVCTVRGLRDRRVRLSVPTAIQLYDLQDRLGLNQPSKVVDWLLDAAKHDINELPPLQMPQLNQPMINSHGVLIDKEGIKVNSGSSTINWDDLSRSNYWNLDSNLRDIKTKEIVREDAQDGKRNEEGKEIDLEGDLGHDNSYISSNNFFPRTNHSNPLPGSYLRWEPSNLSLSNFGGHGLTPEAENLHNFNVFPLPSTLSMPYYPSHATAPGDFDKQTDFRMLGSSLQTAPSSANSLTPPLYSISQAMRPFHLGMIPKLFPSSNSGSEPNKEN